MSDDVFGRFLREKLMTAGVDTRGLKLDKETQTSVSVVLLDKSGERSFIAWEQTRPCYLMILFFQSSKNAILSF